MCILTQPGFGPECALTARVRVQSKRNDVLILFLAIWSHKFFEAVGLGTRFVRVANCSPAHMTLLLLPYHLLPPLAVIVGAFVSHGTGPTTTMVLAALATGTFIYVGAFEVTAEEFGGAHDAAALQPCQISSSSNSCAEVEAAWVPSHRVKWVVMVLGAGTIMGLMAALPESHAH